MSTKVIPATENFTSDADLRNVIIEVRDPQAPTLDIRRVQVQPVPSQRGVACSHGNKLTVSILSSFYVPITPPPPPCPGFKLTFKLFQYMI